MRLVRARCARLLLEAGADATLRATAGTWKGKTALELAEESGPVWGQTALEQVAKREDKAEVAALLMKANQEADRSALPNSSTWAGPRSLRC